MPRVDGTDELSLQALAQLEQDAPLAALEAMGLTRDQAKKLSQLRSLTAAAIPHLAAATAGRLRTLGVKALALAPLIRSEDWSGLSEILETVDPATVKRDELLQAPALLAEKRERLARVEGRLQPKIAQLDALKAQRAERLQQLEQLEAEVQEHFCLLEPFIRDFPDKVRDFLMEHLAVDSKGRLCLAKRLDWYLQTELVKQGVLQQRGSIWLVEDLEMLASTIYDRLNRKKPLPVHYDQSRTPHNGFGYAGPWRAEYKLAKPLPDEVRRRIESVRADIQRMDQEIKAAEQQIRELRHATPQSFMEAVQASNQMTDRDLETHGSLQAVALRWLYDLGYVATAELVMGSRRWDVAGYDQTGRITIIEAKASAQDFRRDAKWHEYTAYCDRFLFVVPEWLYSKLWCQTELDATGAGVLTMDSDGTLTLTRECTLQLQAADPEGTRWAIARAPAKRVIYGF